MKKAFLTGAIAAITIVSALSFSGTAAQAKKDQSVDPAPPTKNSGKNENSDQQGNNGENSGQPAYTLGTCSIADVAAGGVNAFSCQNFAGNDSNSQDFKTYLDSVLGSWSLLGKTDEPGTFAKPDYVQDINTKSNDDIQSGSWQLTKSINSPFVVTVKASDFFSAYLFKGLPSSINSGTFKVSGVTTDSGKPDKHAGLSHLSVYSSNTQAVPTPALLPGLIGMGVAALRKRKGNSEESAEV